METANINDSYTIFNIDDFSRPFIYNGTNAILPMTYPLLTEEYNYDGLVSAVGRQLDELQEIYVLYFQVCFYLFHFIDDEGTCLNIIRSQMSFS